jgi:hypothetical protein
MGGLALSRNFKPQHPAMGRNNLEISRFRQNDPAKSPILTLKIAHKSPGPAAIGLLTSCANKDNIAFKLHCRFDNPPYSRYRRDQSTLHVGRTPAPYLTITLYARKWWFGPFNLTRGHNIKMTAEKKSTALLARFYPNDHISTVIVPAIDLNLGPQSLEFGTYNTRTVQLPFLKRTLGTNQFLQ